MKQVNLEKPAWLKALIYGQSGVGKTYLLGTACLCDDTFPLLVLNAGGQPVSLRNFRPAPLVLTLESVADLNEPYFWFSEDQPWERVEKRHKAHPFYHAVWEYFGHEQHKFRMVAIDSITHIQRLLGDKIVGNENVPPGSIPKAVEGFGNWREMLGGTVNIAEKWYKKVPCHVWMNALTRHNEVPTLGLTMYYPFLQGQSSMEVPSHAELLGRLLSMKKLPGSQSQALQRAEPTEFESAFNVLVTRPGRDYDAKWQGVVPEPEYVLAPTMQKLIDILRAQKNMEE